MARVLRGTQGELSSVLRDYRRRIETLERSRTSPNVVPLVTSLPASPYDGQRVDLWAGGRVVPYVYRASAWRAFDGPIAAATTLPASPYEGQMVAYLAGGGNAVWMLRYRSGAFADPWEFIGGTPLRSLVGTLESTASTSYAALTTSHTVTAPLTGIYRIGLSCQVFVDTAGHTAFMAARVGANAAADSQGVRHTSATANAQGTPSRDALELTVGAAPNTIECLYKTGGGTAYFLQRELTITPLRVSA